MPNIQVELDRKSAVYAAHAAYTGVTKATERIVEGPPVFTGMEAACTFIVSQGFADFLKGRGIPFKEA